MFYTSSRVQFCIENRTAEHINNINSKPNNRKTDSNQNTYLVFGEYSRFYMCSITKAPKMFTLLFTLKQLTSKF